MSTASKKQILTGALIAFSVWPLLQLALVHQFRISPWKLAGWGMYSTPRISPGIGILVQHGDEPPAPMSAVPPQVQVAAQTLSSRRLWLHDLASPDALGRLVLASNAKYRRAIIFLFQPVLDTRTGMVRTEEREFEYKR